MFIIIFVLCQGQNVVPKLPATPIEITSKCDFQRNRNTIEVSCGCDQGVVFVSCMIILWFFSYC